MSLIVAGYELVTIHALTPASPSPQHGNAAEWPPQSRIWRNTTASPASEKDVHD
jgi:hypothetical protein